MGLEGWCFTLFSDSNLISAPDITREIEGRGQKGKGKKIGEKHIERNNKDRGKITCPTNYAIPETPKMFLYMDISPGQHLEKSLMKRRF